MRSNALQDSFYKSLNPEQHAKAHRNEFDFDSPDSIDFDVLVQCLRDLKQGYSSHNLLTRAAPVVDNPCHFSWN
jgi:uridine kinase